MLLTAVDREQWQTSGFWVSPILLGAGKLKKLRKHMDLVFSGHYNLGIRPLVDPYDRASDLLALQNVDNPHWADSAIRELALDQTIGGIAAQLLDVHTIRLWATQALAKPEGGAQSSEVGWHQDMWYWQCAQPADLLTAWVPLEDVDETNGCLQFVTGSHRWGLEDKSFFFDRPTDEHVSLLAGGSTDFIVHKASMVAGQVSFHHCLTLHASGPNFKKEVRRAISIHLMPSHVAYKAGSNCDNHISSRLFKGKDGYPFCGHWFPVVHTS